MYAVVGGVIVDIIGVSRDFGGVASHGFVVSLVGGLALSIVTRVEGAGGVGTIVLLLLLLLVLLLLLF